MNRAVLVSVLAGAFGLSGCWVDCLSDDQCPVDNICASYRCQVPSEVTVDGFAGNLTCLPPNVLGSPVGAEASEFGKAVALLNDTLVVGDPTANASGVQSGRAHVFVRNASTWELSAELLPDASTNGLRYGESVALTGPTPLTALVGASFYMNKTGRVYRFVANPSWSVAPTTLVTNPAQSPGAQFGGVLASSGQLLLVGSPSYNTNMGVTDAFNGATTTLHQARIGTNNHFGRAVAIDSTRSAIADDGTVHIMDNSGANITSLDSPLPGVSLAEPGLSVALSDTHLVIGYPFAEVAGVKGGSVWHYEKAPNWVRQSTLPLPPVADQSVGAALAFDGTLLVVGGPGTGSAGRAWVLRRSGVSWQGPVELMSGTSTVSYGSAVAVSGGHVAVGAPVANKVFLFECIY